MIIDIYDNRKRDPPKQRYEKNPLFILIKSGFLQATIYLANLTAASLSHLQFFEGRFKKGL